MPGTVYYIVAVPMKGHKEIGSDSSNESGLESLDPSRSLLQRKVDNLNDEVKTNRNRSNPLPGIPNYTYVFISYSSVQDLVTQINTIAKLNFDRVIALDVASHGSPISCGLGFASAAAANGQILMTVKWTDNFDIYLGGCNTGVAWQKGGVTEPINLVIANAMKFESVVTTMKAKFMHHLTVWGTCGYMMDQTGQSGAHIQGIGVHVSGVKPVQATDSPERKAAILKAPSYDGAHDAGGANCWIPKQNWP